MSACTYFFSPDQKSTHVLRWLVQSLQLATGSALELQKGGAQNKQMGSWGFLLPGICQEVMIKYSVAGPLDGLSLQRGNRGSSGKEWIAPWRAAGAQANICLLVTQRFLRSPSLFSEDVRLADSAAAVVSHGISKAMASESEFLAHGKGDWVN